MVGSHRFFDHTGDFGVELEAASEGELYEASVHALVDLLVDGVDGVGAHESRAIEAQGVDAEDQLVALGNEVLFLFETGWLTRHFVLESLDDDAVRGRAFGERFEPGRHVIARPIKAVTHHGARVEKIASDRWVGRLIFDL